MRARFAAPCADLFHSSRCDLPPYPPLAAPAPLDPCSALLSLYAPRPAPNPSTSSLRTSVTPQSLAPNTTSCSPPPLAECVRTLCKGVLDCLSKVDHSNIFLGSVNMKVFTGYADIIKRSTEFTSSGNGLSHQKYKYLGEFCNNLDLIWSS